MNRFVKAVSFVISLGLISPPAVAFASGGYAYTVVTWSGTECIPIRSAAYNSSNVVEQHEVCEFDQQIGFGGDVRSGNLYGADPLMGNADWVDCVVTIDGIEQVHSFASRGDGRDVNCLRTAA